MCKVIEDWIQEERAEAAAEAAAEATKKNAKENALRMLEDKVLPQKVAKYTGLPLQEVEKLQATRTVGV